MSNCARPDTGPRPLRRLRDAHALAQLGDGTFYVTSAAYLLRLGWNASEVGLVLGVCWGVGALLARRIGHLADRRGLTAVSAVAMGCCAVGLLGLALAGPVVAGCAFLLYAVGQSAWGGLRATLVQVMAAPATAVIARARLQAVGNGAVAVGAALGGVALAFEGTSALRIVVALDATLYVAAACLIGRGTGRPAREIRASGGAQHDHRGPVHAANPGRCPAVPRPFPATSRDGGTRGVLARLAGEPVTGPLRCRP